MAGSHEQVWQATPWVVGVRDGRVYSLQHTDPTAVFGRSSQQLPLSAVRAVEWVPAVRTVLVRRHWLRDPWRLTVTDADAGEQLFRGLAATLPGAGEPVPGRVGPQDLAMDPKLGLGVLLAFMGLVSLVLGAIEGVGNAPVQGQARRFLIFAELGETIGLAGVLAIGSAALVGGVVALVLWYRRRPTKWVVRAER